MIPHPHRLTLKIVKQLAEARDYYESHPHGLGYEFLDDAAAVMRRACATPRAFPAI